MAGHPVRSRHVHTHQRRLLAVPVRDAHLNVSHQQQQPPVLRHVYFSATAVDLQTHHKLRRRLQLGSKVLSRTL